uniref:PDZ domain-containing protein n=2 Tax=Trichobilharzia regenti TaxID=157069 RepID=A0AA85KCX4_TRIRE|nr:unnamed protein product [Trichobilharzia regenti]
MVVHPTCYYATIIRSPAYGLGLGISGIHDSTDSSTKFMVSDVIKGGPAYGKVSKDDELVGVNGNSLSGMKYSEAIKILRECGEEVELRLIKHKEHTEFCDMASDFVNDNMSRHNSSLLRRPSHSEYCASTSQNNDIHTVKYRSDTALWNNCHQSTEYFTKKCPKLVEVYLKRRDTGESLGVELLSRLTIASVDENSMGARAGLKRGDRIVTLNGINAAHLSLIDTANMLRRQETVLLVAREPDLKQNYIYHNMDTMPLVNSSSVPADLSGLLSHHQSMVPMFPSHSTREDKTAMRHFGRTSQTDNHIYQNFEQRCKSCEACVNGPTGSVISQGDISNICGDQCKCNHKQIYSVSQMKANTFHESNPNLLWLKKSNPETLPFDEQNGCLDYRKEDVKQAFNVSQSPTTRKVILRFNNNFKGEIGLILIGGNKTGIYVGKVIPDSIADQAGVGEGDKLIKLNGTDLKGWTKEEVFLSLMANEDKLILELLYDPLSYQKICDSEVIHESFHVRANFNMNQYVSGSSALISSIKYSGLCILKGDIFHVQETLVDDALGSWLATKVYPNTSDVGLIPNEQRAQRYISANQHQENQQTAFTLPAYERVVQLDKFPFPRPVVIFGPLCELARQRLTQMSSISSAKVDYFIEEPVKFIVPPINSAYSNNTGKNYPIDEENNNKPYGLIRLSAINECMKRGYHCLLDIGPAAIERLILLGVPPIVILINPASKSQLKDLLKHYWQFNKNSAALFIPSKLGSRTRPTIKEMVTILWNSVLHLRQYKSYFITDTVPLLPVTSKKNSFSEVEWLRNLTEVIRHHQNSPVWIGEETEIGQLKVNEILEDDDMLTKDDPETPRPGLCNQTDDNLDYGKEVRKEDMNNNNNNNNAKNESHSQVCQDNAYPITSGQLPMYQSNEMRYNNRNVPFKSTNEVKANISCDCKCGCDKRISVNKESFNLREINEQKDALSSINFPPLSLETLKLHIESTSIKYPQVDQSQYENKHLPSNIHSANETEPVDSQTPTISPTLSLHQLVFDDNTSSDCRPSDEQKLQSYDVRSNTPDPHSVLSSLATSPRTILAEKHGEFGSEGGILEIPEHKVCLRIPAGAISKEEEMQKIFLRVYDSANELPLDDLHSESRLCTDKPVLVSPMVMCGPRGLRFHKPVELTVPRYPLDSESSDESETKRDKHLEKWNLSLLHASAISTSTSADEDSLPRTSRSTEPTKWHEIPLNTKSESSLKKNKLSLEEQRSRNDQGILSIIKDSQISILIDHF